jgi:hypothetical protein
MSINLKYDTDPDALAWGREKVQSVIKKLRRFEAQDTQAGEFSRAQQWRKMANLLEADLIGGQGCVIALFDERMPAVAPHFAALDDRRAVEPSHA